MTAHYNDGGLMNDDRIPFLLKDTDTLADIFHGLYICLDMVHLSDNQEMEKILDCEARRRMVMFCKAVCRMATDYSNDKVDEVFQHYTRNQ